MSIQLLPPQLANQIAAGEVVERPCSVVKELVENSLDAGATHIDIYIEKSGAKCIRIRDNGCGIAQDELVLALARHATSKIATIDDLNTINTLGFRGEALASISSVSRLTLTTKTAEQTQARQAYAEGRDMHVTVKPASHPTGTTVEVLDLFYNTPARRKFLRSDKTEFAHIDELIRKMALTHPHVGFSLSHNQKVMRQYRATSEERTLTRLKNICGETFINSAFHVVWSHDDLAIEGWISAEGAVSEHFQYFFINGRIVTDRLLTHAIRQAYQAFYHQTLQPSFVLYLTLDPEKVDVNVHPTKQEVRFYQTRLVHDFLYHAVLMTLQNGAQSAHESGAQITDHLSTENRPAAGDNSLIKSKTTPLVSKAVLPSYPQHHNTTQPTDTTAFYASISEAAIPPKSVTSQETATAYNASPTVVLPENNSALFPTTHVMRHEMEALFLQASKHSFGRVLTLVSSRFALLEHASELSLLSLSFAQSMLFHHQCQQQSEQTQQPLIMPISIAFSQEEKKACQHFQSILNALNLGLVFKKNKVALHYTPLLLRQVNWQRILPVLLDWLTQHQTLSQSQLIHFLDQQTTSPEAAWTQGQAIQLIAELERTLPNSVTSPPPQLLQPVNLQTVIQILNHHDNSL